MADTKISALPSATTPLAGTELLPIVQGGATTKVAASAFQAPLVSGTSIKTINGNSLLGSGDLTVSAPAAGSTTQVQFNDAGAFGGDTGLAFDKTTGKLTVGGKTVTASSPVLDLSQSWNNNLVTFTGIKFNVVSDVSAAGSLLMDLQVGGTSKFSVNKAGNVNLSGSFTFTNQNRNTISTSGSTSRALTINFTGSANIYSGDVNSGNQEYLFFGASVQTGTYDSNGVFSVNCSTGSIRLGASSIKTYLVPELADTLAQRNGVNSQTYRIYGTWTDAGNNRRLSMSMSTGGVAEIKPEGLGSGLNGNVLHISGLPTSNPGAGILWNDGGTVKVGT